MNSQDKISSLTFRPIGVVQSNYRQKFGTPRQPGLVKDARAFIAIHPTFQPELSLQGLDGFSHLWIIFFFHRNDNARFKAKVHPPRLRGQTMGLFATRSPHRPNPIGLSLVEIDRVDKTGIWVRGIDLMDGTPVIDIKPYLPEVEAQDEARSGWTESIPNRQITVEWQEQAAKILDQMQSQCTELELKELIEQTVLLDPRPLVYHGEDGAESHYRDSHVMRIENLDVHFFFKNYEQAVITKIVICTP